MPASVVPDPAGNPRHVDATEAERLVDEGQVHLLDVRTPQEFTSLGHIPGAALLPVNLIATAPAVVPRDGKPVLVYCEHGIRSQQAAQVLVQAGYDDVLNLVGGMSTWRAARGYESQPIAGPSRWLLENGDLLKGERALDVACGRGRHALLLAAGGWQVCGIDRDVEAIEQLRETAGRLGFDMELDVVDLEQGSVDLGDEIYDLVVVARYLHRPLFPAMRRALTPGGILLYETFTIAQAECGHPKNPRFLLQPGELPALVAPLEVVRAEEGERDGQMVSAVVARKGSAGSA